MKVQQDIEPRAEMTSIRQYSVRKVLLVWVVAALPMGILGWVVAPLLAHDPPSQAFARLAVLTVGLVWQFILVMILVYREAGNLRWSTMRQRLWLQTPRSPRTGESRRRLWWWLLPLLLVTALFQLLVSGFVNHEWVSWFPFLAEPQNYALSSLIASPQARARLVGAWGFWILFLAQALFNTVLGEELLFRGVLLPRMAGAFGRWDWVMNGLLFGLYHVHQPWGIPSDLLVGMVCFALPTRVFRSSWFGIIAHSGQSAYFAILLLVLVLGLA